MTKPQPFSVQVERIIEAPAEVIYDLVSDVTRVGEWSPECFDARWLDGATGPAVGARFKGQNKLGFATWSTKPTITEADRGEVFAFEVPGKMGSRWRYEFHEADNGTRVVESMSQHAPLNAFIRFLQRRNGVTDRQAHLAEGMTTTLSRLAAAVTATQATNATSAPTAAAAS